MNKRNLFVLAVILLTFLRGFSLSSASAEQVISLEGAYRKALFQNESIEIAREDLIQSQDEMKRMKSFFYPKVTGSLDYLRRTKALKNGGFTLRSKSTSDLSLRLSQVLYNGGRMQSAYRGAELGKSGEIFQLALTTEDLLFEIAEVYYKTLKKGNNVEIGMKEVKRLTAHLRSAEKRLKVGEVTRTAVFRAEAELSDARAKLIRFQNDELETKDQLALLTRIEGEFILGNPPRVSLPNRTLSDWLDIAYKNRIELRQAGIGIGQAAEGIQVARGNFLPSLSLEFQYRRADQSPEGSFLVKDDYLALLKLEVPIFEGMLRSVELSQAQSRLRQSRLRKKRRRSQIAERVRRAIRELSSLKEELKHLQERIRFTRETFMLASQQFEVGLGTGIEILDANADLIDAERRYSNTVYDREVAILQIKKETRTFLPLGISNHQK